MKQRIIYLVGFIAVFVAACVSAKVPSMSAATAKTSSMRVALGGIDGTTTAITMSNTGDLWAGDHLGNVYFLARAGAVPPEGSDLQKVGRLPVAEPMVSLAVIAYEGDRVVIYAATKNKVFCSINGAKIFGEVHLKGTFQSFDVVQLSKGYEPDQVFLSIKTPKGVAPQKSSVLAGSIRDPFSMALVLTNDIPHGGDALPRMSVGVNNLAVNTGAGALIIDNISPLRFHAVGVDAQFSQRVPGYGTNIVADPLDKLYVSYRSTHPFAPGDLFPMTLNKAVGNFEPVSSPSDPDAYQAVQDAWSDILLTDSAPIPNLYFVKKNSDLSNDLVYIKPGVSDAFTTYKRNVLIGPITSYYLNLSGISAASTAYFGTAHKIVPVTLSDH